MTGWLSAKLINTYDARGRSDSPRWQSRVGLVTVVLRERLGERVMP